MAIKKFQFLVLQFVPVHVRYILLLLLNTSAYICSLQGPMQFCISHRSFWAVMLSWAVWSPQPERLFSSEECVICLLSDAAGAFKMLLLASLTTLVCQML